MDGSKVKPLQIHNIMRFSLTEGSSHAIAPAPEIELTNYHFSVDL